MSTFSDALEAAKDTSDADAFVSRVKATVIAEIEELDGSAAIADTNYFNHTAIPDLVVTWPRERGERRIYLRHSYEAVVAADDGRFLSGDPMILTLETRPARSSSDPHGPEGDLPPRKEDEHAGEENEPRVDARLDEQAANAPRLLLTDPSALDVMRRKPGTDASPLSELVRANFVRGARGHIDQPRAVDLVGGEQKDGNPLGTSAEELIRSNFFEDAAARIARTAQLMDLALGTTDVSSNDELDSQLVGGRLSLGELRHLLPWLLKQERATSNPRFWSYLGRMMTFADLESIRDAVDGLDVSPLIRANSDRWSAKRAYIGLASPSDGEGDYELRRSYWSFERGAVGIDVGNQRLLLSNNGQLIRGREGTSSALWSDVGEVLQDYKLTRVELHGIRRSVTVNAEQSDDIRGDIEEVTLSLDDNYFVGEVALRVPAPADQNGTVDLQVDLGRALVIADKGAGLSSLTTVALRMLNYRNPLPSDEVRALVTPTESPNS